MNDASFGDASNPAGSPDAALTPTPLNPPSFTLWSVLSCPVPSSPVTDAQLAEFVRYRHPGVQLRGVYDVTGMRAGADLMLWLIGTGAEDLQRALHFYRRTALLRSATLTWSAMGVHREAEFAKSHQPSFMLGLPPKKWLCVYPFVRSYDWYLLPEHERGRMLRDHGLKGRQFPQVQANTVSSFALGDWEWLLGLEADEVIDLVDLMRHLRATDARMHVREEIPFHTGRLLQPEEIREVLS